MSRPTNATQIGECRECEWRDDKPGNLGRAARHHDRTGHEVIVRVDTVYGPAGPDPAQTSFLEETHAD